MKEKIEQLAKGKFEYQLPRLLLSTEKISIMAEAGKNFQGHISISNSRKRRMKGVLYSDSRMFQIQKKQFVGEDNEIPYVFHGEYAAAGEVYEGSLQVVTDVGEASLPYEVQVVLPFFNTSIGEVKDLSQFASLARADWEEAEKLFFDDGFAGTLLYHDKGYKLLYRTLAATGKQGQAMEEFLVAAGKKMPVDIILETTELSYKAGTYNFMDKLVLHKTGWGYAAFQVECGADFIQLERGSFTAADFAGGRLEVGFIVRTAGMKPGVHTTKVRIYSAKRQLEARITCHLEPKRRDQRLLGQKKHHAMAQLALNYLLFRTGRRDAGQYVGQAEKLLTIFRPEDREKAWQGLAARLYQIHIWQVSGKETAAKSALFAFQDEEKEEISRYPELEAGLYYLLAMSKRPVLTVEEAVSRIRPLYRENPGQWLLLWYLLHLDKAYQDGKNKYEAVRRHSGGYAASPVLLFEALAALREEPSLLRCLDGFELRLLQFAVKYQYFTNELVQQLVYLAERAKGMPPALYGILAGCYGQYPGRELLNAICTLVIRNGEKSPRYFKWLKLGVEQQLRITELMEYYLYCMEEDSAEAAHPNVYLYFTYQNGMNSRRKALLYASLIRHKDENPLLYQTYHKEIMEFARGQLRAGAVNKNLAVVYNDCFKDGCQQEGDYWYLPQVAFSYAVTCKLEQIQSISVVHSADAEEYVIPVIRQGGIISLYTKESEVFLVDGEGYYYPIGNLGDGGGTAVASMEKLVHLDDYLWRGYEAGCMEQPLLLHLEEEAAAGGGHGGLLLEIEKRIVKLPGISGEKRNSCICSLMDNHYTDFEGEAFENYLKEVSLEGMGRIGRARTIGLLAAHKFDKEAATALQKFGMAEVGEDQLAGLACRLLSGMGTPVADEFLLELAWHVFSCGKYGDGVLDYLCQFYHGPTKQMFRVWKAAKAEGLDTENLEESLLGQMLFAESQVGNLQAVFMNYYQHGTNRKLIRAYLSYHAYQYLAKDRMVSQELFDIMEREVSMEENEACTLALLKHYSGEEQLTDRQLKFVDYQMHNMGKKGVILPFYRRFGGRVKLPERMYDKYYVEYHANPENPVKIHYRMGNEENFRTSGMKNACYGIFVKSFVLFEAESLQYYITEEQDGNEAITESTTVTMDFGSKGQFNRYDCLNQIIAASQAHEDAAVMDLLGNYIRLEYQTKHLFGMIG